MALQFRTETLATIRRRVGHLMYGRNKFAFGNITAATNTTCTSTVFQSLPNNGWVGRTLYIVNGTGLGQERDISASVQSTGVGTVPNAWTTNPDATSQIEIWPDNIRPEDVNKAINLAVLKGSAIINVYQEVAPTAISSDRKIITFDSSFIKLAGHPFLYIDASGEVRDYHISDWLEPNVLYNCLMRGHTLRLPSAVPSNILLADMVVRGYRLPAELTTDASLCEIPASYVVPMAAYELDAAQAAGPDMDPEQHAARAGNWLQQATEITPVIATSFHSSTVEVDG